MMTILSGNYQHSLDEKGRIIMPSRLRDIIGTSVVLTLGLDNCINVYSENEYEKIAQKYVALSDLNPDNRRFKRIFFHNSFNVEIDKQGRLALPKSLAGKTGITKDVYINGSFDHIEIWSKEAYDEAEGENEKSYESYAAAIAEREEEK